MSIRITVLRGVAIIIGLCVVWGFEVFGPLVATAYGQEDPEIRFVGPRAQADPFDVHPNDLPVVGAVLTQGLRALDCAATERFQRTCQYRQVGSPNPSTAPYAATSVSHRGFDCLTDFDDDALSFDFDIRIDGALPALVDLRRARPGPPPQPPPGPMELDDPRLQAEPNAEFLGPEGERDFRVKRTYNGGTFTIRGRRDGVDVVVAEGDIDLILFTGIAQLRDEEGNLRHIHVGRGRLRLNPCSLFYDELVRSPVQAPVLDLEFASSTDPRDLDFDGVVPRPEDPNRDLLLPALKYRIFDIESLVLRLPEGEVDPVEVFDFGDAPDERSEDGPRLFPSEGDGPRHRGSGAAFLGRRVTLEEESCQEDRDQFDDGFEGFEWREWLEVWITNNSFDGELFLNVLADLNGDGRWGPGEWVIQNMGINVPQGEHVIWGAQHLHLPKGEWTRVTLSGQRIEPVGGGDWDGSHPGVFEVGETEDHLLPGRDNFDFGDAPEDENSHFPSLAESGGPRHGQWRSCILGRVKTTEQESLVDNDQSDEGDDGVVSFDPLTIRTTDCGGGGDIFLNILADLNGDRRWGPGEWVVRNSRRPRVAGEHEARIRFSVDLPEGLPEGRWIRVTLTGERIEPVGGGDWDGSYHHQFSFGETEDYFVPRDLSWLIRLIVIVAILAIFFGFWRRILNLLRALLRGLRGS